MTKAENLRPDVRLWDLIACELRRQRDWHKETQASMATLLDVDQSQYARYESGETPLPAQRAKALDELWKLGGLFQYLVGHAKMVRPVAWWEAFKDYERQAKIIKVYEPSLVPGLLQTEEYARAVFMAGRRADAEPAVEERIQRQAVLTGPAPALLYAIMDPAALYREVGGAEVMRSQLSHLLDMSDRPNVYLRVVSNRLTVYGGVGGAITVMHTPAGDVGYGRYGLSGLLLTDYADVAEMALEFDRIGMESMTIGASRDLVSKTVGEL